MNKLITVIIGQNCQNTIGMCLNSVWDSDKIIFLDGGSTDDTLHIVGNAFDEDDNSINGIILENKFDKTNPNMISEQRNYYLDYLKKAHKNDWVLVLDADEVVDTDGIKKIKNFINDEPLSEIYSIKMRHLMYTLGFEDISQPYHFVPNRLFKVSDELVYPNGEHCILNGEPGEGKLVDPIIWHLGYLGGAWDVKKRYDQQMLRDSGHSKDFLNSWNKTHLLGRYPIKQFNPVELPEVILNHFGINKDELYFEGRDQMEPKHYQDCIDWKNAFGPSSALFIGCGFGQRVKAMNDLGVPSYGIEKSEFAVKNSLHKRVRHIDVTKFIPYCTAKYDLIVAYDVLEHIDYDNIDKVIDSLFRDARRYIIISVPTLGDPNLDADPSHLIKESKQWWIDKFSQNENYMRQINTPEHFLYSNQILIFEVHNE